MVVVDDDGRALGRRPRYLVGESLRIGMELRPCVVPVAIEQRSTRGVEHLVEQEPQRPVGDDVVGRREDLLVERDEGQVDATGELTRHAPRRGLALGVAQRRRDPARAGALQGSVETRRQTACRRPDLQRTGLVDAHRRAAIRHDDELAHCGHARGPDRPCFDSTAPTGETCCQSSRATEGRAR